MYVSLMPNSTFKTRQEAIDASVQNANTYLELYRKQQAVLEAELKTVKSNIKSVKLQIDWIKSVFA